MTTHKSVVSSDDDETPVSRNVIFIIVVILCQDLSWKTFASVDIIQTPPPPLVSSYNDRIRPLLDTVDSLRRLNITQEGISLPTIVVVGDQSSGKSSVLESLAGLSLPRGHGICTRAPLVMRLQHHPSPVPEIHLEYKGKFVSVDEARISEAITQATNEIAGNGKGISNVPLTLVVKKNGVPDLTLVDLPGITRVPVHGQPENIYDIISDIIMEYIKPEETIILNVLSAAVDFPTCESIRLSQKVDKTGQRTLAVVTKADKAPEGLYEKVTADDVNIGLGYVCVRNRIGDETFEEARLKEAALFETHSLLARIDKSMVGIPVLAQKLTLVQSAIISKCLPDITTKINEKLNMHDLELHKLPLHLTTVPEAMTAFMQVIGSSKDSLRKLFIMGEFDEYIDDLDMHSTARFSEMLDEFSKELQSNSEMYFSKDFLVEEIRVLDEANGIWLPHFLPRSTFQLFVKRKINTISQKPGCFVEKVWDHVEMVVVRVLVSHCENYPQLLSSVKRAARNMIGHMKEKFMERVLEIVEMENVSHYTCDPAFLDLWAHLMKSRDQFVSVMNTANGPSSLEIKGFGVIQVGQIRALKVDRAKLDQAFDLKMRMTSYWRIVVKRLVDYVALQLQFTIQNLVKKDMEREIAIEVVGGIEQVLRAEFSSIATKRERLKNSIELLKNSKEVIERVMDKIAFLGD